MRRTLFDNNPSPPVAIKSAAISRRAALRRMATLGSAAAWLLPIPGSALTAKLLAARAAKAPRTARLSPADDDFLAEMEKAVCAFFWEQASPETGLVRDRALAEVGNERRDVASIAATGFGLTGLCIADQRAFLPAGEARARVLTALRFLAKKLHHEHGFFYHFLNIHTGERVWRCECSSIDSAILLCGILTCRQHFRHAEIRSLAAEIFDRVDWPWMLNGGKTLSHGWTPENGFLPSRWDSYCELMMLYLLGLGSSTHPLPVETWDAWSRPEYEYSGLRYINAGAPLFVNQYSHAWFDFRGKRDRYADYFQNSILATRAHILFCLGLRKRFPDYSEDLWGITASDSAKGYVAWGGPPAMGPIDGTLVPAAPGGSLPFLPEPCLRVLRTMHQRFGGKAWKRYGFVDAFNPLTNWYDADVIGIDQGITLLMAENLRSEFVWRTFMKDEVAQRGMARAGFHTLA